MLEKLFKLFDKCEEIRHNENIDADPGYLFIHKGQNHYKIRYDEFLAKLKNHEFGKTTSTGENLDAIKKYNLSYEEASIIYMYTHHSIYSEVNSQLRNSPDNLDEDVREYSILLNNSLNKLPNHNNSTVYRDVKNPNPDVLESLRFFSKKVGKKIELYDYMFSHKSKTRWSDEENGFQFVIKTNDHSNARDLEFITFVQDEEEVVFISGTTFLVESVDNNNTVVYLKEV